ncbi:MAG: hypothetical protein ACREOI_21510 [bacterium]
MKWLYILLMMSAFLLSVWLNSGCSKKTPLDPPSPRNPREYVWQLDTLTIPGVFQNTMSDIWASSAKNVYVAGHSSNGPGLIFSFDGQKWASARISIAEGGPISGTLSLRAIYGFGPDDIWAVGSRAFRNPNPPPNFIDTSLVIHFNGNQWREVHDPVLRVGGFLRAVWGNSAMDLWTSDLWGKLFHFNGTLWQEKDVPVSIPKDITFQKNFHLNAITGRSANEIYLLGWANVQNPIQDSYYFLGLESGKWTIQDSAIIKPGLFEIKWGTNEIWYSPWGKLYSVGPRGTFEWTGSSWINIHRTEAPLTDIHGTSEDNLFTVGHFGNIWHYNGKDWQQFLELKFREVANTGVWTVDNEAFVIGSNGSVTLALHGK